MRSTCQQIESTEDSPKMPPVAVFRHFAKFLKNWSMTFSLFWHGAPNDGTNQLSKDDFDGIALKVPFQGRKGLIGPFSHIYLYYSVVRKCCHILLHHVASSE